MRFSNRRKPPLAPQLLSSQSDGIVGHWLFNEQGGLLAYDSSGNGLHATISGASPGTKWAGTVRGSCLEFDGASGYLNVPTTSALDLPMRHSVVCWFRIDDVTKPAALVFRGGSSINWAAYSLQIGNVDWSPGVSKLAYFVRYNTGTPLAAIGPTLTSADHGVMHCAVGTHDGSATLLYLDGVEVGSAGGNTGAPFANGAPLHIGADADGSGTSQRSWLKGAIPEVRLYRRTLSPGEVMRIYSEGPGVRVPSRRRGFVGGAFLAASADGGAIASGAGSLAASVGLAGVGVAVAGGSAALGASVPLSAAGIAVSSGSAGLVATVTISASGLAQAAGTAGLSAAVLLAAAGAAEAAGNAALAAQLAALASGAAQASGTATLSGGAAGAISASGAAVAGGSAALVVTVNLAATGGAEAGGTATLSGGAPGAIAASGGAEAGGSATMAATVVLSAAGFVAAIGAGQLTVAVELTATGLAIASGAAILTQGAQTAELLRRSVACRLTEQRPFARIEQQAPFVRT